MKAEDRSRPLHWLAFALWTAVLLLASTDLGAANITGSRLHWLITTILGYPLSAERFAVLHFFVRKTAHFVGYGIEGALAYIALRGQIVKALLITLLVAAIDETNQSRNPRRTGSPYDAALDLTGAAVAVAILRWRRAPR